MSFLIFGQQPSKYVVTAIRRLPGDGLFFFFPHCYLEDFLNGIACCRFIVKFNRNCDKRFFLGLLQNEMSQNGKMTDGAMII